MEKLLLEASLELNGTGAIVGMQDMGAAGIICSTSEMSARGNCGMKVYLDQVPLRQQNMEAWEILLSESQERMLVVVKKGREKEVEAIFDKWDLHCAIIGEVINENRLYFHMNGKVVANVPASDLVLGGGAPVYDREYKEPAYFKKLKKFNITKIQEPEDLKELAEFMVCIPTIASKAWVIEKYDTMVGTRNMTTNFPSDAGIVNIKDSKKALAMSVDCNSRYVWADPEKGTSIAVCEAARNIVCSGGEPVGVTNCLNFGNPYNPEVYWQFVGAIKGMGAACTKLGTPVTGGNVSFYNQTAIGKTVEPVFPTPTIGMLGIVPDKKKLMTLAFPAKGHMIFLIGPRKEDISSSQYLVKYHKVNESPCPWFDLDMEYKVQQTIMHLVKNQMISSAHDVSEGGLFITLLESAMPKNLGFDITTDAEIRTDAFLFGESQSRVVISVSPEDETAFLDYMMESDVPFMALGHVTKAELRVDDISFGFIKDMKKKYESVIPGYMA
jgi:phosphoribosylformylglycinamidine synthase